MDCLKKNYIKIRFSLQCLMKKKKKNDKNVELRVRIHLKTKRFMNNIKSQRSQPRGIKSFTRKIFSCRRRTVSIRRTMRRLSRHPQASFFSPATFLLVTGRLFLGTGLLLLVGHLFLAAGRLSLVADRRRLFLVFSAHGTNARPSSTTGGPVTSLWTRATGRRPASRASRAAVSGRRPPPKDHTRCFLAFWLFGPSAASNLVRRPPPPQRTRWNAARSPRRPTSPGNGVVAYPTNGLSVASPANGRNGLASS